MTYEDSDLINTHLQQGTALHKPCLKKKMMMISMNIIIIFLTITTAIPPRRALDKQ
jgi:hypothetical protein